MTLVRIQMNSVMTHQADGLMTNGNSQMQQAGGAGRAPLAGADGSSWSRTGSWTSGAQSHGFLCVVGFGGQELLEPIPVVAFDDAVGLAAVAEAFGGDRMHAGVPRVVGGVWLSDSGEPRQGG